MSKAGLNVKIVFDNVTWIETRNCVIIEFTELIATIEVARQ